MLWGGAIQRRLVLYGILRTESPSQDVINELARDGGARVFERLWNSGRLSLRRSAMRALLETAKRSGSVPDGVESIARTAVADGDFETRYAALDALVQRRDAVVLEAAELQLWDMDPAVRILGLETLQRAGDRQSLPSVIRLIADPEPRVVAVADAVLRRWTTNDFGIRMRHAPAQFSEPGSQAREMLAAGIARWGQWWQNHASEYSTVREPHHGAAWRFRIADHSLRDPGGREVKLSELRGNVVLVSFLELHSDASALDEAVLARLHHSRGSFANVLGVYVPSEHDHSAGAAEAAAGSKSEHRCCEQDFEGDARVVLTALASRPKSVFRTFVDDGGKLAREVGVEEIPYHLLLDRSGNVRRCFGGNRSLTAYEAMIDELTHP